MRASRLTLALGLALGTPFLVSAVSADPPTAVATPATQMAKLPEETAKPAESLAPKPETPVRPSEARSPKPNGRQLALAYPVPTTASAANLLLAADDYAFYTDWTKYRQYLGQVASAYPGSKEAGRALALLADDSARAGDAAAASALSAEVAADYADPETQAFAATISAAGTAKRAKQFAQQEQAYLAYLAAWKDAASAGWVALRLGDLYRYDLVDNDRAIAVYQGLIKDYGSGPIAEEALVCIAETLNWSNTDRTEEATSYYQQALNVAQSPGIQVRALYGLGDMLMVTGELSAATETFSQIIAAYPTHPSAALAYALRSQVAEKRGDWEQTVSDVRAFLTYPSPSIYQATRAHLILGQDAFRGNRLDEAEAEFTLTSQLAATSWHTANLRGDAKAGVAYCAQTRGQSRDAMQLFQQAADAEISSAKKAFFLSQAAGLAQQLGDDVSRNQIIARMVSEVPGDHLTVKLVGHEVLPAPEI